MPVTGGGGIGLNSRRAKSTLATIADFVRGQTENPHYPQAVTSSLIDDALDRFTLWVGNMGALHPPESRYSLEKRLAGALEIRDHISDLLDDLLETLEDLKAITDPAEAFESPELSDEPDSQTSDFSNVADEFDPLKSLFRELSQTLTSLFRVAILVRNVNPNDRFQRALQLSPALPNTWDIKHVDHKFPKIQDIDGGRKLVTRLGTAIAQRRQFLGYCKDHKDRLAEQDNEDQDDTKTIISGATTLALTKELEGNLMDLTEPDNGNDTISMTSAVTTFENEDALPLPRLDDLQKLGPEFECPLCCILQTFSSEKAWRIHAFQDLKAYVCTMGDSDECERLLFPDRTAWFKHELAEHRSRYLCPLCKVGPFRDKKEFRGHVSNSHNASISDEDFSFLADSGRRAPTHFKASDCPFCNDWDIARRKRTEGYLGTSNLDEVTVSSVQFKRHVATHQEQLALFAISGSGENEAGGSDSRGLSAEGGPESSFEFPPRRVPGLDSKLASAPNDNVATFGITDDVLEQIRHFRNQDCNADGDLEEYIHNDVQVLDQPTETLRTDLQGVRRDESVGRSSVESQDAEEAVSEAVPGQNEVKCPACQQSFPSISHHAGHLILGSCGDEVREGGYKCQNGQCEKLFKTRRFREKHERERCRFREGRRANEQPEGSGDGETRKYIF